MTLKDLHELEYILDEARSISLMEADHFLNRTEKENLRLCSTIFKYLLKGVFHLRMLKEEGREINILSDSFLHRL